MINWVDMWIEKYKKLLESKPEQEYRKRTWRDIKKKLEGERMILKKRLENEKTMLKQSLND